jgi:hypothetical protein
MPADLPTLINGISEVVDLMRRFQRAVVRANVPQSFDRGADLADPLRQQIRRHREASLAIVKPEFGVTPLHDILHKINSQFIHGRDSCPDDNALMEAELWQAVRRWADSGYSLLRESMDGDSGPEPIPPSTLQEWQTQRETIESDLLRQLWVMTRQQQASVSHIEMPVLHERQYLVLETLWEEKAFSPDTRITIREIVEQAEGSSFPPGKYKEPVADLKHKGYTDSTGGPKGGIWLTAKGKEIGRRLREK